MWSIPLEMLPVLSATGTETIKTENKSRGRMVARVERSGKNGNALNRNI